MSPDPLGSPAAEVDVISSIVASCPGVAALSGAAHSYLPGRTVPGVSVDADRVDVFVVARYADPLPRITEQLNDALGGVLAGRALYVHIEDIVMPGDPVPDPGLPTVPAAPESAVAAGSDAAG